MSGADLALVAMLNFALRLVAAVGLNVTLTLHDAPAANIAGQFFVIANDNGLVPAMPMLPIVNDISPLFVSVAARGLLVAPTGTVPNLRVVGLTNDAGVTVNVLDFVIPPAVADMETVVLLKTLLVATSNSARSSKAPTGTTTLAATGLAAAALLLARSTVIGSKPTQSHSRKAVAATVFVPTTVALFRSNDTDDTPIGRTERFRVRSAAPNFAVIVPLWVVVTCVVRSKNACVVAPSGTVTLAGVIAAGNVSLMGTMRPPAGAGFLSSTMTRASWQPGKVDRVTYNAGAESGDVIAYVNEPAGS